MSTKKTLLQEWAWRINRMDDILQTIESLDYETKYPLPNEWVEELARHNEYLKKHMPFGKVDTKS